MSDRVFGGFGFDPVQGGVFAASARQSGTFGRIIIADPDRKLVDAVRSNDGSYTVNVARLDGLEAVQVDGVEMYDPGEPAERDMLVHSLSGAGELATSLPSVDHYDRGEEGSASAIFGRAFGMQPTLRRVVYVAEDDERAAEKLSHGVKREAGLGVRGIRFLNTIIGNTNRVAEAGRDIHGHRLRPVAPGLDRAFLVEEAPRVLTCLGEESGRSTGLECIVLHKGDIGPLREADFYARRGIRCALAFLGASRGRERMPELREDDEIIDLARGALMGEVGEALQRKFGDDVVAALCSAFGYGRGPTELLERMTNPYLDEAIHSVARNPAKRLDPHGCVGAAMRLTLRYDIEPRNLALGAAAGIDCVLKRAEELDLPRRLRFDSAGSMTEDDMAALLEWLWNAPPDAVESAGHIPGLLAAAGG